MGGLLWTQGNRYHYSDKDVCGYQMFCGTVTHNYYGKLLQQKKKTT